MIFAFHQLDRKKNQQQQKKKQLNFKKKKKKKKNSGFAPFTVTSIVKKQNKTWH